MTHNLWRRQFHSRELSLFVTSIQQIVENLMLSVDVKFFARLPLILNNYAFPQLRSISIRTSLSSVCDLDQLQCSHCITRWNTGRVWMCVFYLPPSFKPCGTLNNRYLIRPWNWTRLNCHRDFTRICTGQTPSDQWDRVFGRYPIFLLCNNTLKMQSIHECK